MTRNDGAISDCDSQMNVDTQECEETNNLPDFNIEIVKTTRLFSPDKKTKKHKQPQQTMTSMKTVEINDDKSAAEAQAIYKGAAGGVKVATKEEIKESVGLTNKTEKSEKRINLFKKR